MSLLVRMRLIAAALTIFLLFVWLRRPFLVARGVWELVWPLGAISLSLVLRNFLVKKFLEKFAKALSVEDELAARRELKDLTGYFLGWGRSKLKPYNVNILILEERYQEALGEIQLLKSMKLGNDFVLVLETQLAWCKTHLGEPVRAIEISSAIFPQLEAMGPAYAAAGNLVLGTSNLIIGRPAESVPYLEKAYTDSDALGRKSAAAFYLGEDFTALGKPVDAQEAYQRARRALPNGRFGVRATGRLT